MPDPFAKKDLWINSGAVAVLFRIVKSFAAWYYVCHAAWASQGGCFVMARQRKGQSPQ